MEALEEVLARDPGRSGSACCTRTGSARRPAAPSRGTTRASGGRCRSSSPPARRTPATPRSRRGRARSSSARRAGTGGPARGPRARAGAPCGSGRRPTRSGRRAPGCCSGGAVRRRPARSARHSRGRTRCRAGGPRRTAVASPAPGISVSYQWSASVMSSTNQRGKNVVSASSGNTTRSQPRVGGRGAAARAAARPPRRACARPRSGPAAPPPRAPHEAPGHRQRRRSRRPASRGARR